MAYIKVAQVAKEHGSILEKRSELFRSDIASRYQGVPFPTASMVEIHDEVEDVGAFWRHLPHNDPASMPSCARKIVGIQLVALAESIKDGLDFELMDCSARRRSVGALSGSHGDRCEGEVERRGRTIVMKLSRRASELRNGESCGT